MKYELKYNDLFEFAEQDNTLTISGRAWQGLVIRNKKVILTSEKEIENIAETLKNVPIQVDHSKAVRDTIGRVSESSKDGDSVLYRGKVHDKEIAQKIKDGLINQCSVSLAADKIEENFTYQGEEGWTALSGCSVIELSLVLRGAVTGNSVFPEFSFSMIEDKASDLEIEPMSYDQTVESLFAVAYDELKVKYDSLKTLYNEQLEQNNKLNKKYSNLETQYEFLITYGFEVPEKYLTFDKESVMLYGQLMSELKNATKTMGKVQDGEDYTDPKLEAKEALRDLMFNRDGKKKDINTFAEWQKKYGNISDLK